MPGIEHPDLIQAGPPDIHAKTNRGRNLHVLARIDPREQIVQFGQADPRRHCVVRAKKRIAANRRVIGKRRRRANVRLAVRTAPQPIQPVIGHLGVAVQQHHVAIRVQGHAPIHRADKAEVPRIGQHRHARPIPQRSAVRCQLGFRAGIVDQHQFEGGRALRLQDRFDATSGFLESPVHGDDHVHHPSRVREGTVIAAGHGSSPDGNAFPELRPEHRKVLRPRISVAH